MESVLYKYKNGFYSIENESFEIKNPEEIKDILYKTVSYEYYARLASWSLFETAAILANLNPHSINLYDWCSIKDYANSEDFYNLDCMLHLTEDNIINNRLPAEYKTITSCHNDTICIGNDFIIQVKDVINWSETYKIKLPSNIKEITSKFSIVEDEEDWRSRFEESQKQIAKLEQKIVDTSEQLKENVKLEEGVSIRTRNTYNKIIATIALACMPNTNDLNSNNIDNKIQRLSRRKPDLFDNIPLKKPICRQTLTTYLEEPRELLGLPATAKVEVVKNSQ